MPRWQSLLFPDRPRDFPGRRNLKVGLRAAHVVCAALLLGSHAFAADAGTRTACLLAAASSGLLLLGLDLHESCACLLQVRGAVLCLKLLALGWVALDGAPRPTVLAALVVISVVSSHAPASVRYRMLVLRGRVAPSESRG
jgi:hypothetical protein